MLAMDVSAYLARIGYRGDTTATAPTLAALHEAHAATIPFENLDVVNGRPIDLDIGAVAAKLVGAKRGGYCFEQTTLLYRVLMALDFKVTPLLARVRAGGGPIRPRTHAVLRVDLPDGPWVADVGFGPSGLIEPLPLRHGAEVRLPIVSFRLVAEGDSWVVQAERGEGWSDLYAFTLEAQQPVDYMAASHFSSTHPSSPFTQMLFAARVRRHERAVLRDRTLTITRLAGTETRQISNPIEAAAVLAGFFDLPITADDVPGRLFAAAPAGA